MKTSKIHFWFKFEVSDHEAEAMAILRKEIQNILSDNICSRAKIPMSDITSWEAQIERTYMAMKHEGYKMLVSVEVNLSRKIDSPDLGHINTRYGGS